MLAAVGGASFSPSLFASLLPAAATSGDRLAPQELLAAGAASTGLGMRNSASSPPGPLLVLGFAGFAEASEVVVPVALAVARLVGVGEGEGGGLESSRCGPSEGAGGAVLIFSFSSRAAATGGGAASTTPGAGALACWTFSTVPVLLRLMVMLPAEEL